MMKMNVVQLNLYCFCIMVMILLLLPVECWNILRSELDSAIDRYVHRKKQGKRYKKKHLSEEAFRKITVTAFTVLFTAWYRPNCIFIYLCYTLSLKIINLYIKYYA